MKFILASTNSHKAEELNELFSSGNLMVESAPLKMEVVEDGQTFHENALIKAKAYFDKLKVPTLSDDSGLVLPAKPEILGIHSARYAPEANDYKEKNQILLEEIKELEGEKREAYFVCVLCFYLSDEEYYFFEGRVHGKIGDMPRGDKGFGYDPIFYPDGQDGKSLAEVSEWKMQNSHRARASVEAVNFFKNQK